MRNDTESLRRDSTTSSSGQELLVVESTLLEINRKVDDIWKYEKNGGFYPVDEDDIPEGFI